MKKKVCVLTGTRAEYGLLKPVITAIHNSKDLELLLIACGMHFDKELGYSIKEIEDDCKKYGFSINAKVDEMSAKGGSGAAMAEAVGNGIIKFIKVFQEFQRENKKPDILIILGDRIEALAGAITAMYMGIAIAHLHGGDVTKAGLDESARHAITKMANIHFPATKKSAERIIKLGEKPENVFVVGAPGLDSILHSTLSSREELEKKLSLKLEKKFIILLQHPVSTDSENAGKQMQETLNAVKELGIQTIIIYPNADAGGKKIIDVIKGYENNNKNNNKIEDDNKISLVHTFKNLAHDDYLSLMKHASAMVGNSSSGIIESASFKLPVVNIGIRQDGRERSSNVIDVTHDKNEIADAIKKALSDKEFITQVKNCKNVYGEGKTGEKIAAILPTITINNDLLQKKITY